MLNNGLNRNTALSSVGKQSNCQGPHEGSTPLDIEQTRLRLGLGDPFVFSLLRDFNKKYETFETTLCDLISEQQLTDARIYIHTMAGLAGTIAADELQTRAHELEMSLSENRVSRDIQPVLESHRRLRHQILRLCEEYYGGAK